MLPAGCHPSPGFWRDADGGGKAAESRSARRKREKQRLEFHSAKPAGGRCDLRGSPRSCSSALSPASSFLRAVMEGSLKMV